MDAADLLQSLGLTKYEAEAYTALLRAGPHTGYELGKRSAVPLPRIYDVLKRLVDRGLVLTQPGNPPHYKAADPSLFLDQVRSSMSETLDQLAGMLAGFGKDDRSDDFWIVQSRAAVLAHATSLVRAAERSVALLVRCPSNADVQELIALARAGRARTPVRHEPHGVPEQLGLVIDGRQALLGTISPADRCQAIVSTHPALVAAVDAYTRRDREMRSPVEALAPAPLDLQGEWLAWEEEKQRRLLRAGPSVA